jgi:hypothetical protein
MLAISTEAIVVVEIEWVECLRSFPPACTYCKLSLPYADLAAALGSEMIATETWTGDRELSIAQVKTLSALFKVEPGVLI